MRLMITYHLREIENFLDAAEIGYCTIDASSLKLTHTNGFLKKLIDYSEEDLRTYYDKPYNIFESILFDQKALLIQESPLSHYFHLESKLTRKNNTPIWIEVRAQLVKGLFHCVVGDITKHKNTIIELGTAKAYSQILLDLSEEIMFRFELLTGISHHTGAAAKQLDLDPVIKGFPETVLERKILLSEDEHIFIQMVENMKNGIENHVEIRMKDIQGNISWYRVDYRIINNEHVPTYAIGKITNIANEKELTVKAETDSLTALYNKGHTEQMISSALTASGVRGAHYLFVIDIDEFKSINDRYGHLHGDLVLKNISATIKGLFRNSDIVGRVGGDEFIVFMRDCPRAEDLQRMAKKLVLAVRALFADVDNKIPLSISVGIAMAPVDARSYSDLYRNADTALYISKNRGKNQYTVYDANKPIC